jgi:5'(3')-deoxyribonucleotidase
VKPVIAVDIDEVLMPHFVDLKNYYNRTYGTKLTMAHNHSRDHDIWGAHSYGEVMVRLEKFFATGALEHSLPFASAAPAIKTLGDTYNLYVITSRPHSLHATTRKWLEDHFADLFTGVYFADYGATSTGSAKVKAAAISELNANFLIDDNPDDLTAAADLGIRGVLFGKYPWNRGYRLPQDTFQAKNWPEVVAFFGKLAQASPPLSQVID